MTRVEIQEFRRRLEEGDVHVVVVGAGYVGLPLAMAAVEAGLRVTAYDRDSGKVASLREGRSYVRDVSNEVLSRALASGKFAATDSPEVLREADAVVICVPTPLSKSKDPDVSYIVDAAKDLAARLRPGTVVVLESTTYPGFTREVLKPKLEETGLVVGRDFSLGFSPERVDPGNPSYGIRNTPKVVSGCTPACLVRIEALYSRFIDKVVPVSSTDAAEMVKLLENTFRAVNIALVNEVSLMCRRLGLDTWEVVEAAATKPFGYMPFYPGPGIGGHCLPVDPHYLSWKLKTLKYTARFVELAEDVNAGMPEVVAGMIQDALNDRAKAVKGSKVLVLGVAYKKDIGDVRESPALDVMDLLARKGAVVSYHDPHVPSVQLGERVLESVPLEDLGAYDCVAVLTDHSSLDYRAVAEQAQLLVDTRNVTRSFRRELSGKVVVL